MTLTLVLIAIAAMLLFLAISSLRAQRLKERYAVQLSLVALPFVALAFWPDTVGIVATHLGIEYQTVLIIISTTFFLLVTFKLFSIVSIQDRKITSLAQQVGILMANQPQGRADETDRNSNRPEPHADQHRHAEP
jgi:hypothetical protein